MPDQLSGEATFPHRGEVEQVRNGLIVQRRSSKLAGNAVRVAVKNSPPVRAAARPAVGVFVRGIP